MRILFICSSLEPGFDGVGDYSRRLAAELLRQGHQASAIALHDKHLKARQANAEQDDDGQPVAVLRLSPQLSWKKRIALASEFLTTFEPDWVSFQYVPYGYQGKGLPFGLGSRLRKLGGDRKWHVMFHELWVGTDSASPWKLRILSALQRLILKQVVSSLKPIVLHTHLPAYQQNLQAAGITAHSLPLFSTIIVIKEEKGLHSSKRVTLGFFSQVGGGGQVSTFLTDFGKEAARKGLEIELVLIGGGAAKMNEFKVSLETLEGLRGKVRYTGFLTDKEVSAAIGRCDLGISPIPHQGLGKSTSVAAFIVHGIPVAAPVVDSRYESMGIGFFSDRLKSAILTEPNFEKLATARTAALVARDDISLPSVAKKLLRDLQQYG